MLKIPQDTTMGKIIQFDKTRIRSLILDMGDTSYGTKSNNKFLLITGKSYIEKDAVTLKYPYKIDSSILIDLRPFSRHNEAVELEEQMNKKGDISQMLTNAIFMDMGDISSFRKIYIKVVQLTLGVRMKNQFNLDPNSSAIVNNILAVFATNQTYEYNKKLDSLIGVAQLSVIGDKLNENEIRDYVEGYEMETTNDLLKILSNVEELPRSVRNLTLETINDIIAGNVYASHRFHMTMGLESMSSMLSLLYLYNNNSLYDKSQMKMLLKNYRRILDLDYFESNLKNKVIEYRLNNLMYT